MGSHRTPDTCLDANAARTTRRRCLRLLAALALAAAARMACGSELSPSVTVRQEGDTFVVEAQLVAPVPVDEAWDVVTDVGAMAGFVPAIEVSRVVAREGARLSILQRGAIRFGPIAFAYTSERDVLLVPRESIRQVQTRGTMPRLETLTTLEPDGGGTRLDYRVLVRPDAPFPDFVTRFLLRRETAAQLEAIRREMLRRHAGR